MERYLTELIGTFFLVLTIGFTALSGIPSGPLAIGSVLMVMVYMGGHVSGAHYNPAISLGVFLRGKLSAADLGAYMVAQFAGAILAALAVLWITGQTFAPAPGVGVGAGAAVAAEAIFTFALVLVVLNVATHPATEGNSYYGLAIGFTVLAGAVAVGGLSGGAFNPAVGVGPILIDAFLGGGTLGHIWYYLVGPFLGGIVAAAVFRMQLGKAG